MTQLKHSQPAARVASELPMKGRRSSTLQRVLESRLSLLVVIGIFVACISATWHGPQSIAVADEVAYIVSGLNLVNHSQFVNSFGAAELWFPPVYPLLIGALSRGGLVDPFLVARLISVVASVGCLLLTYNIARRLMESLQPDEPSSAFTSPRVVACLASLILACNPTFQMFANRALSEPLALCLTLLGFRLWLRDVGTWKAAIANGLVIGLAALTRPECILVLPLWYFIDVLRRRDLKTLSQAAVAGTIAATLLAPYVIYLHEHTGKWSISNKAEVNLAAGRANFHQVPREYINEDTLELGYYPVDTSQQVEVRRHLSNYQQLVDAFSQMYYRPIFGWVMWLLIASGIVVLCAYEQQRIAWGLAAMAVYLAAVLNFDPQGPKSWHLVLPAVSLLVAIAVSRCFATRSWIVALPLFALMGSVLLEGASRHPRWVHSEEYPFGIGLKVAGEKLKDLQLEPGVMYEYGATAGYYSGMTRRYLTPNRLDTVLAHIAKHEPSNVPVYLALSSGTSPRLDQTVNQLLDAPVAGFEKLVEVDAPERVVIYRLQRDRAVATRE